MRTCSMRAASPFTTSGSAVPGGSTTWIFGVAASDWAPSAALAISGTRSTSSSWSSNFPVWMRLALTRSSTSRARRSLWGRASEAKR
ncbi:hypothetical protein [Sorangium sp. So ce693]|uniref:hypothetical protein n=1 Tax=Sorangium sp. So ce693 TaxID=3133318 RepID=UPI003F5E3E67